MMIINILASVALLFWTFWAISTIQSTLAKLLDVQKGLADALDKNSKTSYVVLDVDVAKKLAEEVYKAQHYKEAKVPQKSKNPYLNHFATTGYNSPGSQPSPPLYNQDGSMNNDF